MNKFKKKVTWVSFTNPCPEILELEIKPGCYQAVFNEIVSMFSKYVLSPPQIHPIVLPPQPPPLVCYPFCAPLLVLLVGCALPALIPAPPLLRLALTRGVCVSPLQCRVVLCLSGSRWRLFLPVLRFSLPDLGGMNFFHQTLVVFFLF